MEIITSQEVFDAVKKLVRTKRAVFFDRDGTLCKDAHYLSRMEDFEIFPSLSGLKRSGRMASVLSVFRINPA